MAIGLNVTSEQLEDYSHDQDNGRFFLEVASLTLWLTLLAFEIIDAIRYVLLMLLFHIIASVAVVAFICL